MTKEIKSEIIINSPPQKIWKILTDFEKFPTWNPFMVLIKGTPEVGCKLTVHIKPPNGQAIVFKPKVISRIENKELSWLGKLIFNGLCNGVHKFELVDNNDGSTTFIQSEVFSGILVGLFNLENTEKGFLEMNKKLKAFIEKGKYKK